MRIKLFSEMFKSSEIEFFKENFFVKENIESSEIFHLSK
jgi:hypothetical protein